MFHTSFDNGKATVRPLRQVDCFSLMMSECRGADGSKTLEEMQHMHW